jgi:very-short-patch-repair endonuclease
MPAWEETPSLARRRQGVITRAQLREAGLSQDSIDRRIARGALVPRHAGVFAVAGSPDSFAQRAVAAVLAAGRDAAASHRAAATLLELGELTAAVEVSVPLNQRPRLQGVVVHRVSHLPPEHTVVVAGIRVTHRARTLCDLAGVLPGPRLELLLDQALARRSVTVAALRETLESLPVSARGAGKLRALLAARPSGRARAESPLEQELQELLLGSRIKGWKPQHEVVGCRIDVAFPREKLALQVDSYRHHSSRSDWARDHRRHVALVAAGWRVLPVTLEDLRRRNALVARVRAALAAAGP